LNLDSLFSYLPEVTSPKRKLLFNERIYWTAIVLAIYFILSMIPLYGLSPQYKTEFEMLSVLLAAQFGSVITLGIGPIVTASIILQLLIGADVLKIDTNTPEGKKKFGGMQKLFSLAFIIVENAMYVMSGALPPAAAGMSIQLIMIAQLIMGGILIMFMDEVASKWGIGSGISLFIVAGVSREVIVGLISPVVGPAGLPIGALPQMFSLIVQGLPSAILWPMVAVVATVLVFTMSTYAQSIKVNIPLSFGRVRGFGIKWPLNFVYTSNMPVILVAAMLASMQFWGLMMFHAGLPILGTYERRNVGGGYREVPVSGLVKYMTPPSIRDIVINGFLTDYLISILVYLALMLIGSIVFSILWIEIGGQGASNVADQILSSGLSIPGFRRDKRILERILNRYIKPLTVMGGFTVGLLAVVADLFGALSRGTGILLSVMIIYNFYEQISQQYLSDMSPRLRKFFSGS
jgi:preprotein translocase subunit SecY